MTANHSLKRKWGSAMTIHQFGKLGVTLLAVMASGLAWAQTQVTGADHAQASDGSVTITLSTTGDEPVVSVFATDNPSRIVLDMANTNSSVGSDPVTVNAGSVTSYSTLSASGRTRVLVDLTKDAEFDYNVRGGMVQLTVANGGGMASSGATAAAAAAPTSSTSRNLGSFTVENVDFRRGEEGQSRVIVALDQEGASVAVNATAGTLIVEVFNADLPDLSLIHI